MATLKEMVDKYANMPKAEANPKAGLEEAADVGKNAIDAINKKAEIPTSEKVNKFAEKTGNALMSGYEKIKKSLGGK